MKYLVKNSMHTGNGKNLACPHLNEYESCKTYMFCPFPDGIKTVPLPKKGGKNK